MGKIKILIVDDNESFLDLLEEFLLINGYDVIASASSEEALKIFIEFVPDIVITDIVMPDVDGIELFISLRKINPKIKVIAMSGGNKGHADTYLLLADNLGANVILSKPFELTTLLAEINKLESSS